MDTEVRKLDQLRAAHLTQQHNIRWQLRTLPRHLEETKQNIANLQTDIITRDMYPAEHFALTIGRTVFSGKGAPEEAAHELAHAISGEPTGYMPKLRGSFRGFDIVSQDKPLASVPDLFLRAAATYTVHINPTNPLGTVQSIEHTLRSLERLAADQEHEQRQLERNLSDYQAQAGRRFEHEARLKELLKQQAKLNAALDLDKSDLQAADAVSADETEPACVRSPPRKVSNPQTCAPRLT